MKQGLYLLLIACVLSGCLFRKPYDIESAQRNELIVADDAYHLSGYKFTVLENNEFEESGQIFYVEDEAELAKLIQYAIDNATESISYQSKKTLDLDQVSKQLCVLNPFDISLLQNDTSYKNRSGESLYVSHHITISNPDKRYEAAKQEAKRRVAQIIDDAMSLEEKITAIHDNIIATTSYEEEQAEANSELFQASSVLLDGVGVCSGYSRAFMLMAKEAGIEAVYVSASAMNHGWNYVRGASGWRHIDITWDDPVPDEAGRILNTYLNMDEDAFFYNDIHILNKTEKNALQEAVNSFFSNHPE